MTSIGRAYAWHRRRGSGVAVVVARAVQRGGQFSHIRGVSGVVIGIVRHWHIVVARLYRLNSWLSLGSGLAREWWQEGMLRVRATLCRVWARGDYGLSRSGSLSGRCVVYK